MTLARLLDTTPPRLFTVAACGSLKPTPDSRLRGAHPHLLCSSALPLLVVCSWHTLVQVLFVTGPGSAPTKIVREARAKLQKPSPNALIRNKDAALRQGQLDISKAQAEYVVEPGRTANQLGWKTMAIMWVWRLLHSSIFAQDRAARQTRLLRQCPRTLCVPLRWIALRVRRLNDIHDRRVDTDSTRLRAGANQPWAREGGANDAPPKLNRPY
jgi:hypothetical protein